VDITDPVLARDPPVELPAPPVRLLMNQAFSDNMRTSR